MTRQSVRMGPVKEGVVLVALRVSGLEEEYFEVCEVRERSS